MYHLIMWEYDEYEYVTSYASYDECKAIQAQLEPWERSRTEIITANTKCGIQYI